MGRAELGKVGRSFLARVILRNTGASSASSIVGPGLGLDNAVVALDGESVMIITADPLSIVPALGMEDSAWLTVHELASDFTTSAVKPQFAILDYNLPPELSMESFEKYVKGISAECKKLGVAIVGGHTGKYPGCGFTIVGGGVLLGTAGRDGYLTPAMARDGDVVLMSKGTAIETTAVLARAFPETVKERLGKEMARRAAEYLHLCSTVDDALAAASIGVGSEGVTAMHDATEGGILGGLHEFALSCGLTLVAEEARIHVSDESRGICKLFRLDPLVTLSEGTLIMACGKNRASAVQEALKKKKIDSFLIGELKRGTPGLWVRRKGRAENVTPPEHDPYWAAYIEGIRRKWA